MQYVRRLMISVVVLAMLLSGAGLAQAQGGAGQVKHTVQAGETLYRIALKYERTVDAVAQANNITNPNLIYVGQELTIPGASTATTPTPVASVSNCAPVQSQRVICSGL